MHARGVSGRAARRVLGGQFVLSNGIKWIVDRARPAIEPLTGFAGTSFPSGHSVAAAATWTCVSVPPGPAPTSARPCSPARWRGRRRRRRLTRRARGALDDGRRRRAARRLDVVHAVRDRVSVGGCCTSANPSRSSKPKPTSRPPFAPRDPAAEATVTVTVIAARATATRGTSSVRPDEPLTRRRDHAEQAVRNERESSASDDERADRQLGHLTQRPVETMRVRGAEADRGTDHEPTDQHQHDAPPDPSDTAEHDDRFETDRADVSGARDLRGSSPERP